MSSPITPLRFHLLNPTLKEIILCPRSRQKTVHGFITKTGARDSQSYSAMAGHSARTHLKTRCCFWLPPASSDPGRSLDGDQRPRFDDEPASDNPRPANEREILRQVGVSRRRHR